MSADTSLARSLRSVLLGLFAVVVVAGAGLAAASPSDATAGGELLDGNDTVTNETTDDAGTDETSPWPLWMLSVFVFLGGGIALLLYGFWQGRWSLRTESA